MSPYFKKNVIENKVWRQTPFFSSSKNSPRGSYGQVGGRGHLWGWAGMTPGRGFLLCAGTHSRVIRRSSFEGGKRFSNPQPHTISESATQYPQPFWSAWSAKTTAPPLPMLHCARQLTQPATLPAFGLQCAFCAGGVQAHRPEGDEGDRVPRARPQHRQRADHSEDPGVRQGAPPSPRGSCHPGPEPNQEPAGLPFFAGRWHPTFSPEAFCFFAFADLAK